MYDIRQFKPALYFLLLLGMTGFALAAEWPGLWVLAAGGILLNAWLVHTGRFTPMPRLLASLVTIIAFVYIADLVLHSSTTPILIIGQFLVLLQLVKLYEQRANRDYAQLIILSLLLMVAAAINTASLLFGLMFIGYLFLSLYVCLLFHLKVESEDARKAIALPEMEPNPATLRQDQRYLASSMRRLTVLISIVAVTLAVVVFLFFPRGTGANLLGPLQFKPSRALTGFSEQVGFQQVARITQNYANVADVTVYHNGKLVDGIQPLYLRGLTLDHYNGANVDTNWGRSAYQWMRLLPPGRELSVENDDDEIPLEEEPGSTADTWRQEVKLQPTGSAVLFGIEGPTSLKVSRRTLIRFSSYDQALQLPEPLVQTLDYSVTSNGKLKYRSYPDEVEARRRFWGGRGPLVDRPESEIDPKIKAYARRPEVSGIGPGKVPYVELRDRELADMKQRGVSSDGIFDPPTRYDGEIANAIQNHLRSTFTYTLDLTDAKRIEGQDPMVAFLYDFKRGHCEYFAGAMALMCQSLGMPARMVIGFRCDDFNNIGHYYAVRQNQAHAWVEVRTGNTVEAANWERFDPTSGREDRTIRATSVFSRVRHFFDFLEHTWANNVIAYDRGSRDNLVQNLETRLTSTAVSGSGKLSRLPDWLKAENFQISSTLLTGLVALAVFALFVAIGWYLWERWRLWRRAERIGLDALPPEDRIRLARQLGFYDDLVRLLERRGMVRPRHRTPMEFSDSLSFLPADGYHDVRRLTEVFYRVRYGRQELTAGQRDKLAKTIGELESILGPPTSA
jgi:transglutaminase-like putative cysteine protease